MIARKKHLSNFIICLLKTAKPHQKNFVQTR